MATVRIWGDPSGNVVTVDGARVLVYCCECDKPSPLFVDHCPSCGQKWTHLEAREGQRVIATPGPR